MSPPPAVAAGSGGTTRTDAPAKVNLGLRITSRRADGYHELRSVFLRLLVADEVTLDDTSGARDTLVVEGDPACPVDDNLVLRATGAYRAAALAAGTAVASVAIRLQKHLPMEAGLAGGSSDAAAVLRLLAHRYPGAVLGHALASVGQRVGSDVPFFVAAAGAALVSDAGIEVEPLPPPIEPLGVLLVTPDIRLATGRVFAAWDDLHANGTVTRGDTTTLDRLATELRAGATPATIVGLAPQLRDANDLWLAAVAVEPGLEGLRDTLEGRLGWPVLMTGSGSTLLALTTTPGEAAAAAERLRADPPDGLERARIEASASGSPYPPEVVTDRGAGA
jgi:4-diphosphocytidyl-2-C-methyl-D-erythritol kinase